MPEKLTIFYHVLKKKIKSSDLKRQRLKSFQVGFNLRAGYNEFQSLTACLKTDKFRINLENNKSGVLSVMVEDLVLSYWWPP